MPRLVSLLLLFSFFSAQPALLKEGSAAEKTEKTTTKAASTEAPDDANRLPPVPWHSDYAEAMDIAEAQGRMLLVFFHTPAKDRIADHFESAVLSDPKLRGKLRECVCVRLPLDTKIKVQGKDVTLIDSPAFEPMNGRPGVAVLDFAHRDAAYYGCLVGSFPFSEKSCYSVAQMGVILDLPPGRPAARYRIYVDRCRAMAKREKPSLAGKQPPCKKTPVKIKWLDNYAKARKAAEKCNKMLLIHFCQPRGNKPCNRFKTETLDDPDVADKLQDYVCVNVPLDTTVEIDDEETVLMEHHSFKEMLGKPGIAIVDFANTDADHYGQVVSTFPITKKLSYTPERMTTILTLPPGSLTQRTLIYAVRVHPDNPASTRGRIDPVLTGEAESHSRRQAKIRLQGHHNWDSRFRRINARLPRGLVACEVCAESWPGENLVEAAIECVRCWRFSEGHWSAVRAFHRVYGYDMRRGKNGIWYATGIFGKG